MSKPNHADGAQEVSTLRASIPDAAMVRALLAFPPDALKVLEELGDGEYVQSAEYISGEIGVPAKRIREVHRALRTLGFASFGPLMTEDGLVVGSGYWATRQGDELQDGVAQAIEARRAETAQHGSVVDESAAAASDAPKGDIHAPE